MEICTLHEAVCMEAGWLSKQAGFCFVVRRGKNQPGSRDELIYVSSSPGLASETFPSFQLPLTWLES